MLAGSLVATWAVTMRGGRLNETAPDEGSRLEAQDRTRRPVVVELFTSEGCSSCPPADALLAEFAGRQPIPDAEIIALEEHVDYWDHLGWRDPFSSREFTERQEEYERALQENSPYTPQMVVDGRVGFVGSQGRRAQAEISAAAQIQKSRVELTVEGNSENSDLVLRLHAGRPESLAPGETAEIYVALTEDGLVSAVRAGENGGKTLRHAAVVRQLRKIGSTAFPGGAEFTGSQKLRLPAGWNRANLRAVAFVQEAKTRRILGAASASVVSRKE